MIENFTQQVIQIRDLLEDNLRNPEDRSSIRIDKSINPIPPFKGNGEIKLIVIALDPTIKNPCARRAIKTTLNLDRDSSVAQYVSKICASMGIFIENVYATNVFKYFYTAPPAGNIDLLYSHLEPNLKLLQEELAALPNVPIITLGQPLLQLLAGRASKVTKFWDFDSETQATGGNFSYSKADENLLGRDFYPFPHQPASVTNEFYKNTIVAYTTFFANSDKY